MPTPNFNLPDQIDDWSTSDVYHLDSTIASMLQHTHNGIADEMEELSEEPELTYNDDDGSLPPGVTYFYRVSLVDEHGRESLASDVATISIPAPVDEPGAPTATILEASGSLSSGTYLYAFSAWSGDPSQETMLGGTVRVVVSPQHSPAQIRLDEPSRPDGADGWNLYRSRPGSADFVLLTTLDFTTHTDEFIVDTGLIVENPNQVPSRVNTTRTVNSVEVEYPGGTVPAGFTWNVFRSEVDGYWENSLVWRVVEETAENSGIITPVFLDTGYPQMGGQPVSATTLAPNPQRVLLTNGAHVSGILPAEMVEGGGAGLMDLGDLQDVDLSGLADGYSIFYDEYTDTWYAAPGGSGGPSSMGDLSDVNLAGLGNGEVLAWNATLSQWEPTEMSGGGGASGSMVIDLTGESPGLIPVDLSSVPPSVFTVVLEGPPGDHCDFDLTLPSPTRGPMAVIVKGDPGYMQRISGVGQGRQGAPWYVSETSVVVYPVDDHWEVLPDKYAPGAQGSHVIDLTSSTPVSSSFDVDLSDFPDNASNLVILVDEPEEITLYLINEPVSMTRGSFTLVASNNSGMVRMSTFNGYVSRPIVLMQSIPSGEYPGWIRIEIGPFAAISLEIISNLISSLEQQSNYHDVSSNTSVHFGLIDAFVNDYGSWVQFSIHSGSTLTLEDYSGPIDPDMFQWMSKKVVHEYEWGIGGGSIVFDLGKPIIWEAGSPPSWSGPGEADVVEYTRTNYGYVGRVLAQGVTP